ncbi:hypothetical protein DFH06DRAFT_949733, partial [Mycena polygramma]
ILQSQNAILSKIKSEISEVESAMRAMQAKRDTLVSEARLLRATIRQHQGVLSPIRCLPPEIVGEIFLYFVPALGGNHHVPVARSPWRLGHICRYWRSVALSVQSLWSV